MRTSLTLKEKVAIIKRIQSGEKQRQIATELSISKSTINGFWINRNEVIQKYECQHPDRKRVKTLEYEDIDGALLERFRIQRSLRMPINGPMLITKALEFAKSFGHSKFKCSDGWLDKWKKRHDIRFRVISGDAGKVDLTIVENWVTNKWETSRVGYSPEDIYNCDETGCFWNLLPDKTFYFSNETCSGGSKSKQRITILFCVNRTGTDKRKPLVIGKFEKPRPFKVIENRSSLPVEYFWNSKSWMNTKIFEAWLRTLDLEMNVKGRNILLTLDNVSSHPQNLHLKNIKLIYFPPNCTSILQPLDQGIIKNFKVKYRQIILEKILRKISKELEPKVNLLEAVFAIHAAWLQVTPQTISNCFKHCKIFANTATENADDDHDIMVAFEDLYSIDFDLVCEKLGAPDGLTIEQFFDVDQQICTKSVLTDAEIIEMHKRVSEKDNIPSSEEEDDVTGEDSVKNMSLEEALDAVEALKLWALSQENSKIVRNRG